MSVEKLVMRVMEDDRLIDKLIDDIDMYDNHDLAVDSAKKGYYSFLLTLSIRERIYNYTRIECLKYATDTSIRLYLLRDILTDMIEKHNNPESTMIDRITEVIISSYSERKSQDITLEEALANIDINVQTPVLPSI